MLLILTHENADFDAVASLLAASKLYPHGATLLPRRVNRNVNQFLALYWNALPFMRPADWKKRRVDDLLLVDTQSVNSVRGVVGKPAVTVIDHHTGHAPHENWTYRIEALGATTTILVEMMQGSGLSVTPEEATLLLLGIHEDTGSLTYPSTTPRDMWAAAWLLEQGAQLTVVRRFLKPPLTDVQRDLYERLFDSAEWTEINGHAIVFAEAIAPEGFDEEISSVVHRLRDVAQAAALFAMVQLGDDVQLVARSSSRHIDVSVAAGRLGGGGHGRAAAALVIGKSLRYVRQQLDAVLKEIVTPLTAVSQLMSHGVQTIPIDAAVSDAYAMMQKFSYEGYPVIDVEKGKLVGLLTRRAVDRAMGHGMEQASVSRIMRAGQVTVTPADSIEQVQRLMLREGWGQIPVFSTDDKLIGIVTRTDLLNHLFKPAGETAVYNMRQLLPKTIPPAVWKVVLAISETAAALHQPLYFVGGLVRDVILGIPAVDLDMVVEGNGIRLAKELQRRFGGDVHAHARFGTAKWALNSAVWQAVGAEESDLGSIDFVTSRTEFYTEPSALPEVERGSIKLDLHRRDFSVNTLAVRLDGAHLGELLDFYNGVEDLNKKRIRVLHSLSFIDDPTRMLRAARLEQRLGFVIEPRTAELIANALPMMSRVTGKRIRHELELALGESQRLNIMARLADLGVLTHIYDGLTWTDAAQTAVLRAAPLQQNQVWKTAVAAANPVLIYFALWMSVHPFDVQSGAMERLAVKKSTRLEITAVHETLSFLKTLPPDAPPSLIEKGLRPFSPLALFVARAATTNAASAATLDRYYGEWAQVETAVSGDDIRALGLPPGPAYADILDQVRAARLDGDINNKAEAFTLLKTLTKRAIDQ